MTLLSTTSPMPLDDVSIRDGFFDNAEANVAQRAEEEIDEPRRCGIEEAFGCRPNPWRATLRRSRNPVLSSMQLWLRGNRSAPNRHPITLSPPNGPWPADPVTWPQSPAPSAKPHRRAARPSNRPEIVTLKAVSSPEPRMA
jgi:hypothetical protein